MNSRMLITGLVCAALAVWVNGSASAQNASPVAPDAPTGSPLGTRITYQGQLLRSNTPYTGTCSFVFGLWDAATGGKQSGTTLTTNNVAVNNGIFAVELDFGNQFQGEVRWIETGVKCTGDTGSTTLSPRQPQNAVPYAISVRGGARINNTTFSENGLVVSANGAGISANSAGSWGIYGSGTSGVYGEASSGPGVYGRSRGNDTGVTGLADGGGAGVAGVGTRGPGVYAKNNGSGLDQAALTAFSENPNGGIAIYGHNASSDNTMVLGNDGNGGLIVAFVRGDPKFSVSNSGRTTTKVVEIQGGADLAEKFSEANGAASEPGTVMVIDANNPGQIKPSSSAYDRKVVGIVSGAGGVQPGLTLQQEGVLEGDTSLAIAGRVYVKADARTAEIKPGDLLTTSDLLGYAMKASDGSRSHGAVMGKAMTGLANGTGLVLVVVNLQ